MAIKIESMTGTDLIPPPTAEEVNLNEIYYYGHYPCG